MSPGECEVTSRGPEETLAIGETLGQLLRGGEVLSLVGELGAGKTLFVKGLARGLGIDPRRVTSPTFVLHQIYEGRLPLHHLDLYRLQSAAEFDDLGIADHLGTEAVLAVEWGDRLGPVLPPERLTIHLEPQGEEGRRIGLRAENDSLAPLVEEFLRRWPSGPSDIP